MMKGIILAFLIILIGFVFVSAEHNQNVKVYPFMQEGWNLVYSFIEPKQIIQAGDSELNDESIANYIKETYLIDFKASSVKEDEIKAIYAFVPTVQKYALVYPDPSDKDMAILRSIDDDELIQMAFWVYSEGSGRVFYNSVEEEVHFDQRPIYTGWNFVGLSIDLILDPEGGHADYTLEDVKGNCDIEKAFIWDGFKWLDLFASPAEGGLDGEIDDDLINTGLVIKVTNDCNLGMSGTIPPQLPN